MFSFMSPYPQRTHILRLSGPKTLLYKFLGYFDAKGSCGVHDAHMRPRFGHAHTVRYMSECRVTCN